MDDNHLMTNYAKLHMALKALYEAQAEYVTINKLGDVHATHEMRQARDALCGAPPPPADASDYLRSEEVKLRRYRFRPMLTVGFGRQGEADFSVSMETRELDRKQMANLREMIPVAIGQFERIWREQGPPSQDMAMAQAQAGSVKPA